MATGSRRPSLLAIVGPTASGKSDLAMKVALKFGGDIISADSRTIYKGMDIGTAKPTREDQRKVPHHMLDVVLPDQKFSVGRFKKLANQAINDIESRGRLPIIVGGSGLYIDSVLFDYKFKSSKKFSEQNPRHRLKTTRDKMSLENCLIIGLDPGKEALKEAIETRVGRMISSGFIDEVVKLSKKFPEDLEVFKTPGYGAFLKYIKDRIDLPSAILLFVDSHMKLAKKQRTWFKRNPNIRWFENRDSAFEYISAQLNN